MAIYVAETSNPCCSNLESLLLKPRTCVAETSNLRCRRDDNKLDVPETSTRHRPTLSTIDRFRANLSTLLSKPRRMFPKPRTPSYSKSEKFSE
jgi:hypothetical protein